MGPELTTSKVLWSSSNPTTIEIIRRIHSGYPFTIMKRGHFEPTAKLSSTNSISMLLVLQKTPSNWSRESNHPFRPSIVEGRETFISTTRTIRNVIRKSGNVIFVDAQNGSSVDTQSISNIGIALISSSSFYTRDQSGIVSAISFSDPPSVSFFLKARKWKVGSFFFGVVDCFFKSLFYWVVLNELKIIHCCLFRRLSVALFFFETLQLANFGHFHLIS